MPDPAHVARDTDRSVLVTRHFDAPPAKVWQAFTDPALLTRWLLGPPGWEMHVCEMDVRTGGSYRWRWRNAETGEAFGFTGQYTLVVEGERTEDTQTFDQGNHGQPMGDPTTNIVTFEGTQDGTCVTSRMIFAAPEQMEGFLAQGATDGMEMSYARLDALFADEA